MLSNYFAAALRAIRNNRMLTLVNIVGLSLGIAAAFLAVLYWRHYAGFDEWLPQHDRIVKLEQTYVLPGATPMTIYKMSNEVGEWVAASMPEVEHVARFAARTHSLRQGEVEANDEIYWSDPQLFAILQLPTVAGELATALQRPDGIVLTRNKARKYFGTDDAVGRTLEVDRKQVMSVTAVVEDLPANTHLKGEIYASGLAQGSPLEPSTKWETETYLELREPRAAEEITAALSAFRFSTGERKRLGAARVELAAIPVTQVAYRDGNAKIVLAFGVVGVLILTISTLNFVNLMTAAGMRRRIEVGVRKVNGASRRDLIVQFIGESVLHATLAFVLALVCVQLALPALNAFLDQQVRLSWSDIAFAALLSWTVGVLGALYPSVFLASFKPALIFNGRSGQATSRQLGRQLVVTFQFGILVVLLVVVIVIFRQTSYLMTEQLRLNTDQVVLVQTSCRPAFKDAIAALPGVASVACAENAPLNKVQSMASIRLPDTTSVTILTSFIGAGFFELYGVQPIAGRLFSDESAQRAGAAPALSAMPIVLNETAVRKFRFNSAQDAIGKRFGPREVIGVVPDFWVGVREEEIPPTIFHSRRGQFKVMSVRLRGAQIPQTLEAIDRTWRELGDPKPINRVFLDEEVQRAYLSVTRQGQLFAAFSAIAIIVGSLGLLGLSIFAAVAREREVGVRKAFGADRRQILLLLMWQFTKPVLWSLAIAWPLGYFAARAWLNGFAYRVELEWWHFVVAGAIALVVAWLTTLTHAMLAARLNPAKILRSL